MARSLRLEHPGATFHIHNRGVNYGEIFRCDEDRFTFLALLEECTRRFHWVIHQYTLMTNHYHLLVETPAPNLAIGMRQLNGVFTQRFNHRHSRVGHLFQGRYHAVLVEKEAHLLELSRYIVLNPVRARLVDHPDHWPWSSYRAMAGREGCSRPG